MELQLALALALPYSSSSLHRKRTFFEHDAAPEHTSSTHTDHNDDVMLPVPPTLSLLPLIPNHHRTTTVNDEEEEEVEGPVGWPPLNYRIRKNLRHSDHHDELVWIPHHRRPEDDHDFVHLNKSKTQYVKVKMEGVGIARKIDLAIHHSFHTLNQTLMHMFGKCDEESKCYELAYQDKEGDWLLAQDVPWRSFIQCAQRLKLLKMSSSTG